MHKPSLLKQINRLETANILEICIYFSRSSGKETTGSSTYCSETHGESIFIVFGGGIRFLPIDKNLLCGFDHALFVSSHFVLNATFLVVQDPANRKYA